MPSAAQPNRVTPLSFSGRHITARAVENVRQFAVGERTIVVNVGTEGAPVVGSPGKCLRPFHSTVLQDAVIARGERLVLLSVARERNLGRVIFEPGWLLYWDVLTAQRGAEGAAATGFPRDTPLYRSSQDSLGLVSFDPRCATGQRELPGSAGRFVVKVNLWFAPERTDCVIHNTHDFIEVHTQVHGTGRMQKFRERDVGTLYEDTLMAPGYTTPEPFCAVAEDGSFHYPWHQYYSDSDCVWLAVEYHPA